MRGMSLIEVLVMLVILAVIATVLVLSLGAADGNARLRDEAIRLAGRIDYACERAELTGRTIGLTLHAEGYGFLRAEGEQWRVENDRSLQAFKLPKGLHIEIRSSERESKLTPRAYCFASGEQSAFEIEFVGGERDDRFRVRSAWPEPTQVQRRSADQSQWQTVERGA